jgi:hypothetical protein
MIYGPIILCLLNCITENIWVLRVAHNFFEAHVLGSPDIDWGSPGKFCVKFIKHVKLKISDWSHNIPISSNLKI